MTPSRDVSRFVGAHAQRLLDSRLLLPVPVHADAPSVPPAAPLELECLPRANVVPRRAGALRDFVSAQVVFCCNTYQRPTMLYRVTTNMVLLCCWSRLLGLIVGWIVFLVAFPIVKARRCCQLARFCTSNAECILQVVFRKSTKTREWAEQG